MKKQLNNAKKVRNTREKGSKALAFGRRQRADLKISWKKQNYDL